MTRLIDHDQAAGLRNLGLFRTTDSARVFTIAGGKPRIGKTSIVINLANALARNNQRVLLIDENPCHNNICSSLGLQARFDLLHVIHKDKSLDQVLLQGPDNVTVLPAMRGIQALNKLDPLEEAWLIKCFADLTASVDVVLIDTAMAGTTYVLPLSLASEQVVIVISSSVASLTGAYALIKIMSQEYDKQHFMILVNKVNSEVESLRIYQNLYKVARQYLSVTLEYAGFIPNDGKLHHAGQLCRPVAEVHPNSPSALNFEYLAQRVLRSSCPDKHGGEVENFMQRLIRNSHLSMANLTV